MQELFSAFGLDWHLLLVQLLNVGVLVAVLTYVLFKPVQKMIDERREKIARGVQAFEAAEQHLANAQKESEGIVGAAGREAEGLVAQARIRAQERHDEIVKQAEAKAQALVADSAQRAEEERRRTLTQSNEEIARAATLAAEKLLRATS